MIDFSLFAKFSRIVLGQECTETLENHHPLQAILKQSWKTLDSLESVCSQFMHCLELIKTFMQTISKLSCDCFI